MEKKDFIEKGLMGTNMFAVNPKDGHLIKNEVDELHELEVLAFNASTDGIKLPKTILHKAETRGHINHGWLESNQTFSFSEYYNPDRMHFGLLRVLNDDRIAAAMGFGTHPHDNMEIISIPLKGALEHKDSMGNVAVIKAGDIQSMTAGTGIFHSEYNKSETDEGTFLQIWVFPNKRNVTPRYDQITLSVNDRHNNLQQIVSPNADDAGVQIQQDAWFYLGKFDKDFATDYQIKKAGNGVYAFVIKGDVNVTGIDLHERDALGVWDTDKITITANSADAEILIMDIPMTL